jgi:hypothetical protein
MTLGPACGGAGDGGDTAATPTSTETTSAEPTGSSPGTNEPTSDPVETTDGVAPEPTSTTAVAPTTDATDTTTTDTTTTTTTDTTTTGDTTGDTTTGDTTTGDTTTDDTTTIGYTSTGDDTTGDATTGDATTDDTTTDDTTGDTTGMGGQDDVLYVRPDGQNSNPGTKEQPLRTIQWAIAQAVQLGTIKTIRVAEGEYSFDYANKTHIVMAPGVSLHGGYRSDWGARDPAQYVTRIVDATPTPISSTEDNPHRAIEIPDSVTADTVLEGFHVTVKRGQFRAAVFIAGGDATLRNNVIEPVIDNDSVRNYGLRVLQGNPTVVANRIRFNVIKDSTSAGISASQSSLLIANNVIDMSNVKASARAIELWSGAPKILGNSVYLMKGVNVYGIHLTGQAKPVLDNNLLDSENLTATCVYSSNAQAVPSAARNNVLNCATLLSGTEPLRTWTSVTSFEAGLMNATNNLKLTQSAVHPDNDLQLDAQDLCTVTRGGRDITADIPKDINGVTRTVPLSIGAHEWDGDCQ